MVGAVVKIVIGLFIWMVLPRLIYSKRKYQKNSPQFFVKKGKAQKTLWGFISLVK
jgi:hypothetical protein